jgi:hypothetical protein
MNSKPGSVLNELNTMRRQMGLPTLNENELLHLELNQIDLNPLTEGWWENAKYTLSKLGRYKAGGKIFGKSQTDAKAIAQITALLDKQGNEVIKGLDRAIKQKNPEFPNNKSQLDFVNTVIEIATVYDSLVGATKLKTDAPGYLPVDAANKIIEDLRVYSQKYLDVDLTAAFSVFNEEEETQESIDEASNPAQQAAIAISKKERGIDEADNQAADLKASKAQVAGKFAGTKAAIEKGELDSFDTERMKTLKSWRLPLTLLGTGASFGALSWLVEYLFSPKEITTVTQDIVQTKAEAALGNINPGEGMTQIMNRTLGLNLSPSSNPNDVVSALSKLGGGDASKGVEIITQQGGIFKDPAAAKATLSAIVSNPTEHGTTLKQVFTGTWAGTGKAAGDTLVTLSGGTLTGMVTKAVMTWVTKKTIVGGSKLLIAAPVLKVLGIGLLAGGVAAALARWKGRKSSRAQVLNDLIQYLRPTEGTKENPPVIGNEGGEKNPKGGEQDPNKQDPNKQGKSGSDQQLYINLKKYFQDLFNFKGQVSNSTYGQGGSSNPTKQYTGGQKVTQKITQPNDINDIIKLMEEDNQLLELLEGLNRLVEADDSLGRSINAKGQAANAANSNDKGLGDIGLSSNELKLFKTNVNRLSGIIKAMNKFSSGDKNLNNLISQAKSNPISSIDVNQLLVSDDKSLKIFVSNFNKALYSIQFKNGNSIMDQLKLVNINKLSEAAERVPSKGDINKVYNLRKDFLKNLPNYVKSMYAVFSYLIDQSKKGTLGQASGKSNSGNKTKSSTIQAPGSTQTSAGKSTPPEAPSTSATPEAGNASTGNKNSGKDGTFYDMNEDVQLMDLIETHNNLMDIILENMDMLKEFGENQPEMQQGMEDATVNSDSGRIFTQLSIVVPEMSGKIANAYKQQYGQQINRVKLAKFLQTVLGSFAKVPQQKMVQLINRGDMDVTAYKRMLKDIKNLEGDAETGAADAGAEQAKQPGLQYNPGNPEKFLPNKVGNYDLSKINQAARIALSQKAAEIISRNNDTEQSSENMLTVIKQLVDDINKNGQRTIPTV